jgi:hypothetical protein
MNYKHFIDLLFNEIETLISFFDMLKMTESEKKELLENLQNIKSILIQHKENTKEDFKL